MKKHKRSLTILDAMSDDKLFARWFRDPKTWAPWRAFLASLFALRMTSDQLAIYQKCTGRTEPPSEIALEAWLVCGRRAGKSFILALIAVFLACFHDWRPFLSPGEKGMILVIATDRRQARVIIRYIRALLTNIPMLAKMIEREEAESFDLTNFTSIEVGTASFRSVRGYTIVAALLDEIAFWPTDDAANPDFEILNAIRPGTATIPNAMLLCASSPYARRGELWNAHREHFAKDGDPILVWQADTRTMNPTVPQSFIDKATERDPSSAAAEYGANFRTDIESFVQREAVEACIEPGVRERAPSPHLNYFAFIDPSGGSGSDSMTLAIGHRDKDVAVLDAIRERVPKFNPSDVVAEFAELLKSYRITKIIGDKYAGEWAREPFKSFKITYDASAQPKSDIYRDGLPFINARKIQLLDHPRLVNQICALERRTARGGKDSIDHPPNGHDDLANAALGVVDVIATQFVAPVPVFGTYFTRGPATLHGRELHRHLCQAPADPRLN